MLHVQMNGSNPLVYKRWTKGISYGYWYSYLLYQYQPGEHMDIIVIWPTWLSLQFFSMCWGQLLRLTVLYNVFLLVTEFYYKRIYGDATMYTLNCMITYAAQGREACTLKQPKYPIASKWKRCYKINKMIKTRQNLSCSPANQNGQENRWCDHMKSISTLQKVILFHFL